MKTLFLASCLALSAPVLAQDLHYNIVNFSESATVNVANDTMNIVLSISEQGNQRQAVSHTVTRRLNIVQNQIKAHAELNAEMTHRHVYPHYNDKNQIVAWTDSVQIRIQSQDFQVLNQLITKVQNEARVENLSFSISPQRHAQATEEASQKALAAFRLRAKNISQSLGFDGRYKLVQLNLNQSFEQFAAPAMAMARSQTYAAKSYTPEMDVSNMAVGESQIRQMVNASIQLD